MTAEEAQKVLWWGLGFYCVVLLAADAFINRKGNRRG